MRLRTLVLAICAFSLALSLFAAPPSPPESKKEEKVVGPGQYGAVNLEAIQGMGLVKLNGTTVAQSIELQGSVLSTGAQIGALDVRGEANLTDTVVRNASAIAGYLQAHKTTFQNTLTLTSQKAVFVASKLQGITFRQDGVYKGKQILELKQGTLVDGPITFESGKGEILLYSGSQVLGPIKGGKVLRKS